MKRALVLAGGAARGAYQVGMLDVLVNELKLDFQIIRGVSVGALNAAFLAQAAVKPNSIAQLSNKVRALRGLWEEDIKGNHSVYGGRGGFAGLALGADSLYSLKPLRKLIKKYVSLSALRKSGRDFAVGTVSLVTGEYKEWKPKQKNFIEKLIASASIPVVFPYVDFESEQDVLVDGGVRNITPLSSAFKAKPDQIYVLLTSKVIRKGGRIPGSSVQLDTYDEWDDNWLGTSVNGIDVLKRTLDILTDEVYLDDIRGALDWNQVANAIGDLNGMKAGRSDIPADVSAAIGDLSKTLKKVRKRPVEIFALAPREWYGEENSGTDFSPALIQEAIQHGREIAGDESLWLWSSA